MDSDYNPVEEGTGIPLAGSAWFVSSSPKSITTAGEVRKSNFIHTFTESSALISSAYPVPFCPNAESVSWGVSDDTQIQIAYTDEEGVTRLYGYFYYGEWLNSDYDTVPADEAIVGPGVGFWIILNDPTETFAEVSPLAE